MNGLVRMTIEKERRELFEKYRRRKVRYLWISQVHSAIIFSTGTYSVNNAYQATTLLGYCINNGLTAHVYLKEILGSEYCTDEELLTCPNAEVRALV